MAAGPGCEIELSRVAWRLDILKRAQKEDFVAICRRRTWLLDHQPKRRSEFHALNAEPRKPDLKARTASGKDTRLTANNSARLGGQTPRSKPGCEPSGLRLVALPHVQSAKRAYDERPKSDPATCRKKDGRRENGRHDPRNRRRVQLFGNRNSADGQCKQREKRESLSKQRGNGPRRGHGCPGVGSDPPQALDRRRVDESS